MNNRNYTASFYTLGCRVNQYETRAITEEFMKAGFEIKVFGQKCDVCVINTCAVTAESERKSAQHIRRASKFADIVMVVGCYSEYKPKLVSEIPNVRYVGGARDKTALAQKAIKLLGEANAAKTTELVFQTRADKDLDDDFGIGYFPDSKVRGFVKVEDGCNGKCSYCIIPKLRGSVRLRKLDDIVAEIERLASLGCREVALTGIEISAHNKLPEIIESVAKVDGIERIRLGSLDPRTINERFLEAISNEKFMPHLHISLQSASDRILNLMRRPYNKAVAARNIERALERKPDLLISVDIISSFPSETKEELEETIEFLRQYPISHVHAFPYSPRPGTVAAEMKELITPAEKKARHAYLLSESKKICMATLEKLIGSSQKVLVENCKNGVCTGCIPSFVEVRFKHDKADLLNKIVTVKIDGVTDGKLTGKLINF